MFMREHKQRAANSRKRVLLAYSICAGKCVLCMCEVRRYAHVSEVINRETTRCRCQEEVHIVEFAYGPLMML